MFKNLEDFKDFVNSSPPHNYGSVFYTREPPVKNPPLNLDIQPSSSRHDSYYSISGSWRDVLNSMWFYLYESMKQTTPMYEHMALRINQIEFNGNNCTVRLFKNHRAEPYV